MLEHSWRKLWFGCGATDLGAPADDFLIARDRANAANFELVPRGEYFFLPRCGIITGVEDGSGAVSLDRARGENSRRARMS
jgi:hypothetical protein